VKNSLPDKVYAFHIERGLHFYILSYLLSSYYLVFCFTVNPCYMQAKGNTSYAHRPGYVYNKIHVIFFRELKKSKKRACKLLNVII
jgi:hypothetical protein